MVVGFWNGPIGREGGVEAVVAGTVGVDGAPAHGRRAAGVAAGQHVERAVVLRRRRRRRRRPGPPLAHARHQWKSSPPDWPHSHNADCVPETAETKGHAHQLERRWPVAFRFLQADNNNNNNNSNNSNNNKNNKNQRTKQHLHSMRGRKTKTKDDRGSVDVWPSDGERYTCRWIFISFSFSNRILP